MVYLDKKDYRLAIGYQERLLYHTSPPDETEDTSSGAVLAQKLNNNVGSVKPSINQISSDDVTAYSNTTFSNDDVETIDQNAVVEKYRDEVFGKVR